MDLPVIAGYEQALSRIDDALDARRRFVPTVRSPIVRRRELGALLRALRANAELTVEQVAEHLLCSLTKVSRMETGQRGVSLRDVRDLCDLYGVTDPAQREHLMRLAREGRGQAWWQPFNLPYATYVGLEAEAVSISDYEPTVFPGLVRTPAYARAVHERTMPKPNPGVIDQWIEVRVTRQQVLTQEDPLHLRAIIDEAVLHRIMGGPAVMHEQLDHCIEASDLSNVTIQVLPFSAGAHPAIDSTFIVLELAEPVPSVVYVEGLVGQIYLERPEDVQRYERIYERLEALSLSPSESVDFMAKLSAIYKRG
jgi:transcriptional regulator with XRE-family HTH domain